MRMKTLYHDFDRNPVQVRHMAIVSVKESKRMVQFIDKLWDAKPKSSDYLAAKADASTLSRNLVAKVAEVNNLCPSEETIQDVSERLTSAMERRRPHWEHEMLDRAYFSPWEKLRLGFAPVISSVIAGAAALFTNSLIATGDSVAAALSGAATLVFAAATVGNGFDIRNAIRADAIRIQNFIEEKLLRIMKSKGEGPATSTA